MDTNLPDIDIVEDIASVMEDNENTPENVQMTIDETEKKKVEDDCPFIIPEKKKKKELSEKQKAHLEKIRKLSNLKRQQKAEAKKQAVKKVEEEHRVEKKVYKKKTKNIPIEEPREQELKENTPEDFVPSHKEKIKEQKRIKEENSKYEFVDFIKHMEQYNFMKHVYNEEQKKQTKKEVKQEVKQEPKKEPKKEVKKEVKKEEPISLIVPSNNDPYFNYFG